uniref:Rho GDP dissociation inhibitor beta n=2 Tax=Capra hircus TaxID=9925 RepID=A0A8C2NB22_CAPHI
MSRQECCSELADQEIRIAKEQDLRQPRVSSLSRFKIFFFFSQLPSCSNCQCSEVRLERQRHPGRRRGPLTIKMTEKAPEPHVEEDDDELDGKLNYKPPPQKSLKELQEMDKDDESLIKYKKTLLGDGPVVADPTAPNVTVTRLTLVCESAPGPITMDLTGDLEALKKETFVLKEGVEYRVKINFKVNKDIVSGLKYVQHTYRTGVKVDKATFMVGSYGPRPEEYEFLTPIEEAPKGMLARGTYHNKSFFTDDDKHDHLTWEWNLSIKKDWTE